MNNFSPLNRDGRNQEKKEGDYFMDVFSQQLFCACLLLPSLLFFLALKCLLAKGRLLVFVPFIHHLIFLYLVNSWLWCFSNWTCLLSLIKEKKWAWHQCFVRLLSHTGLSPHYFRWFFPSCMQRNFTSLGVKVLKLAHRCPESALRSLSIFILPVQRLNYNPSSLEKHSSYISNVTTYWWLVFYIPTFIHLAYTFIHRNKMRDIAKV